MELYGRGSLIHGANVTNKNLNVQGLDALDLRTRKPSGEPWDFPKPSDRTFAVWLAKTRKATWVSGAPPCTACSNLQGLEFPNISSQKLQNSYGKDVCIPTSCLPFAWSN